ncbi:hypothetical protein [Planctomonas psychrotolerans]|uniref:hypothetical protein n=1 Tax=Planctomonas psychrotolerans TaxID=2528712 RepID=UPI001239FBD2|nr:hypothetical protein [Planctomonas psychrotolerans]
MRLHKVRVDGQEFFLSEVQEIDDLKELIVAAVRQGGDFVTFHTVGRGPISVLCTPGIPVRIEVVERSEAEVDGWSAAPPSFDIDEVLYRFSDWSD